MTRQSLIAYSVGLLGFVLVKVLASAFYARQNTKTPVKVGIIAMSSNMVLNFIFIWPLQHAGLALATALSALINAGLLYRGLRQQAVFQPLPGWLPLLIRLGLASSSMALFLIWQTGDLSWWLNQTGINRAIYLFGWIGMGMGVYFISLFLLGFRLWHLRLQTI